MRDRALERLLDRCGWTSAVRRPLAGDASRRRYARLTRRDGSTRILMDAPPDSCGSQAPFLAAAGYLAENGLSAPSITAADTDSGFIVMEDLGGGTFARAADACPEAETEMYDAAVDVLAALRAAPDAGPFPPYAPETQADLAALALEFYAAAATGRDCGPAAAAGLRDAVRDLVAGLGGREVFTHRDFHAENLIWLPRRDGVRRVGLLDFQDAARFHPAYDLASLTGDARRDVSGTLRRRCVRRWCDLTGESEAGLSHALAVCGAQRGLRILGVFARLAARGGKSGYLSHLPRVWRCLQRDLCRPALAGLAGIVNESVPPPSSSVLRALRERRR